MPRLSAYQRILFRVMRLFKSHSVAYFLKPLLEAHDRNAVEIFCYAEVTGPDTMTEKLRNLADNWCCAPVIAKPETDEIYFTPMYYTLAHFSKYLRPGAKRILPACVRGESRPFTWNSAIPPRSKPP